MILAECYGQLRFTVKRKDGARLCGLCLFLIHEASRTHRLVESGAVK